ncbi:MAG: hypothetical protein WC050_01910 [Candidatus Paceibacterota bacterium]
MNKFDTTLAAGTKLRLIACAAVLVGDHVILVRKKRKPEWYFPSEEQYEDRPLQEIAATAFQDRVGIALDPAKLQLWSQMVSLTGKDFRLFGTRLDAEQHGSMPGVGPRGHMIMKAALAHLSEVNLRPVHEGLLRKLVKD